MQTGARLARGAIIGREEDQRVLTQGQPALLCELRTESTESTDAHKARSEQNHCGCLWNCTARRSADSTGIPVSSRAVQVIRKDVHAKHVPSGVCDRIAIRAACKAECHRTRHSATAALWLVQFQSVLEEPETVQVLAAGR